MSECSGSPSDHLHDAHSQPPKRKAAQAGLDGHTTGRSVKRRASKACQCCRARKVRCNVTEHGAPCTNCRLDEVECIVSESRRKKKWPKDDEHQPESTHAAASNVNRKLASRDALDGIQNLNSAAARPSHEAEGRHDEHVPHSIYQSHGRLGSLNAFTDIQRRLSMHSPTNNGLSMLGHAFTPFSSDIQAPFFANVTPTFHAADLPPFIKPLPAKIGPDEIAYLERKGALTVPKGTLRSELLRAYLDYVHPYMPLLDLHDFLTVIDQPDGSLGKVSLILFQAVMFAGSAFVDMHHLRAAGYGTRKEARKDFFQKTRVSFMPIGISFQVPSAELVGWTCRKRQHFAPPGSEVSEGKLPPELLTNQMLQLLYDFDYESDRVSLVQALLLLTYYYETPDDQKDTWHWMGVATSVAHTIGLHRNPDKTNMDAKRVKLWKRIWWSTYMRDRLIALGMRRPTRIKSEDFDVPMLTIDDFEIAALPESISCVPADCRVARDVDMQRQLAIMCIEKAKLCLCISHVLSKQYCVLNNAQGMMNDRTTMMLLPKKLDPETSQVKDCDEELQKWVNELPEAAQYTDEPSGDKTLDLHRALLHMVFFTTLSALHRPQVLPSSHGGSATSTSKPALGSDVLEVSRRNVRRAASAITSIAQRLDQQNLVKYLPTTGVTVLLPAIIIHLLDIKAPEEETRRASLRGFCQCMTVMGKLRDLYAAADYSTAFLEAAIRKAGIHIAPMASQANNAATAVPVAKPAPVTTVEDLVDAGRRLDMASSTTMHRSNVTATPHQTHIHLSRSTLTPPPDGATTNLHTLEKMPGQPNVTDEEVARRLETFLASTPPESDHDHDHDHELDMDGAHLTTSIKDTHPGISISHSASTGLTNPAPPLPTPATTISDITLPHNQNQHQHQHQYPFMSVSDLPPNPFHPHHQDDEVLFSSLPMPHEFDDGDFDSLLNLDAVGETFNFEDGMLDMQQADNLGEGDWMGATAGGLGSSGHGLGEEVKAA
ncbi:uncharacterized protein EI97DRAFT_205549 [Westerdykella ornata]|uniref:Zn(2)-C6 fungal-type domain-containing protein n=1 Tax=Westerdykella ornata TaxID=318751 RepID=A0A6A6JBK6_WESOR|nr:uncharacterized protein EI97DRAFT_205549 [Westerdykella ornata]KAF2272569.1 hypothetical protein EI97DRAFT_205549 [Westerdykella ornata]